MKAKFQCVLVVIAMGATACMPDHMSQLDGKITTATFSKNSSKSIVLKDLQGNEFFADSSQLVVKLEVNRISASRIYVSDQGRTAVFEIPKSLLNQKSSIIFVPSEESRQPVDLRVIESPVIMKEWSYYQSYFILVGKALIPQYRKVRAGTVKRSLLIDVFEKGASARGYRDAAILGSLKMVALIQDEILSSYLVNYSEYSDHVKE